MAFFVISGLLWIEVAFEKNVLGTLRDDLFERMTANYEKEQRELIQPVAEAERQLANAEQDNIDLRAFLSIIRKCTDLREIRRSHNRLHRIYISRLSLATSG